MKIIKPITITDSIMTSTTVTDSTATWDSGTTYPEDTLIQYDDNIYKALRSTTGDQPDVSPDDWQLWAANNIWAAFDGKLGNATSQANIITYNFEFTASDTVTGIAFFGVEGTRIAMSFEPDSGTPIAKAIDVESNQNVYDWYTYFFADFDSVKDYFWVDIPEYSSDLKVRIDILNIGATAEVSEIVLGEVVDLGLTQRGMSLGIIDYSAKDTDSDTGAISVLERAYSKRLNADVLTLKANANMVATELANLRASPVVFIPVEDDTTSDTPGTDNFANTIMVYGYMRDYSFGIPHDVWVTLSLEVEGLT